jgi:hypothetical protein
VRHQNQTVDLALASTGPRGLDAAALVALARRQICSWSSMQQPQHQRWANTSAASIAA